MLLPGPEAQQLATYIGWLMHRTLGGIVAGAFFVIPSVFVLLALSYIYAAYGNVPAIVGALNGFKPVVVAVVVEAILKIGGRALKRRVSYLIAAAAFVAIYWFHVPFPLIVLAAGLIGLAQNRSVPPAIAGGLTIEKTSTVIDDHAPPPAHTLPSRGRALMVLAVGILLWLLPFAALLAWRGWDSLHAQQYRFFSQAALVTFGGAYAVLAYTTQHATASGWLTAAQSVDGLALAETTPGPLIMVLQFLGFMAAWNNPQGLAQGTSAVTGALLTTYTTFLPSFVFIFLGAPYIEKLRGNKHLTAALSGITAAVVGVILNLALVFGLTVLFPHGVTGGVNWFALALSAASFAALYKFKIDALWVVLASGAIGCAWTLIFGA
jgi:chromate transporter